jgi:hypothetical protein
MKIPNIVESLDDPDIFKGMFDAPSWRPWRALLTALAGLPMDDATLDLYRRHTGRVAPPMASFRAATLICGRRAGKTRMCSVIATYLACVPDHSPYLVAGETAVIALVAMNRQQAQVALHYIVGLLRSVPGMAAMIVDVLAETIRLSNGVTIEVHTGSIGSPRGRTFLCVIADECAFWPQGEVANPDEEVINAVRPGLATIPYSLLLIASSPYARRGVLYRDFARYWGKDDAPTLVWKGSTTEMNSSLLGDPLIAQMYEEDPDRAASEFGAEFRSDIVAFISREAVEAVVAHGVRELPPGGRITYQAFTDPSGGSADSFTLAIGHMESDGTAVLDALREQRPPFSPDTVVQEYAALLKSYNITRIYGDAYAGEWPRERFAQYGITYEVAKRNKSTIYAQFLPALNSQRVRLLDHPRLIGQLCNLERRTARGGRDSIDHQPGSNDDVCNAACGVLTELIDDRRPALIKPDNLLQDGQAVEPPVVCNVLFGAMAIDDKTGALATVYAAYAPYFPPPLRIVDFDIGHIAAATWEATADRVRELAARCRARDARLYVPAPLLPSARSAGVYAEAIPKQFADPAEMAIAAAGYIGLGQVKLTREAEEKAKCAPFLGAFDLRAGDLGNPLIVAATVAVLLALEDQRAVRRAA